MSFTSLDFVFFFPFIFFLYLYMPAKLRWLLLLSASYYFYAAWKVEYLILIVLSTCIDYICAIQMERRSNRLLWLLLTLFGNLGLLFYFKYFNFALNVGSDLFLVDIPYHDVLLPIGISFYTLQTIGYSIDVYKGKRQAERHFGYFALYVSFFPQLVAGPIERSTRLLPQLRRLSLPSQEQFRDGVILVILGFMKKLMVANQLMLVVTPIFEDPSDYNALSLYFACYLAMVIVYCDFSAYSDIARGCAKMFGVELMKNFNSPLMAPNIRAFWQRWHISLTKWIIDYVHVPLARKVSGKLARKVLTLAIFSLIGLWHGADIRFILFGLYHGVLLVLFDFWLDFKKRYQLMPVAKESGFFLNGLVSIALTLLFVSPSGALFYADNFDTSVLILSRLFEPSAYFSGVAIYKLVDWSLMIALSSFLLISLLSFFDGKYRLWARILNLALPLRWGVYILLMVVCLMFGDFQQQEFVYFQF